MDLNGLDASASPDLATPAIDLLEGLNEPQREAVQHGEGPLLILAGPGGRRRIPLAEFFKAYRVTALAEDEILLSVELKDPEEGVLRSA